MSTTAAFSMRSAASVVMLPITHPLTGVATAHAAGAGAAVWALLSLAGAEPGVEAALACATPLVVVLVLAAATCPHRSARCHALRLLLATALAPVLLLAWAAALPLALAPVVVALGALFLLACHASAFGFGAWRVHRRSRASHPSPSLPHVNLSNLAETF